MSLPTGELAMLRRDAEELLIEQCTIKRPGSDLSDSGYPEDTETTVAADVPCRIVRRGMDPFESATTGQIRSVMTFTVLLHHDQDVRPEDIIESGNRRLHVAGGTADTTEEIVKQVLVNDIDSESF